MLIEDSALWSGEINSSKKAEEVASNKFEKSKSFLFEEIKSEKERYKFKIYVLSLIISLQIWYPCLVRCWSAMRLEPLKGYNPLVLAILVKSART